MAPAYYNGKFTSIDLDDYLGKWVLLFFYPADFTFVCSSEIAATVEKYEELQNLGVEVISVSVDSVFAHKVWSESELEKISASHVPYAMASDQTGQIGTMYGVYDEEIGVNARSRFIIDPDGNIQGSELQAQEVGRNVTEMIRQIRALQMVREVKGAEVAPAGWAPGKKTIQPSADLVGNVWKKWKSKDAFED